MTKYRVYVSVNVSPEDPQSPSSYSTNALYHQQNFVIEGDRFGDVAPTIDGIYEAIRTVVEARGDG